MGGACGDSGGPGRVGHDDSVTKGQRSDGSERSELAPSVLCRLEHLVPLRPTAGLLAWPCSLPPLGPACALSSARRTPCSPSPPSLGGIIFRTQLSCHFSREAFPTLPPCPGEGTLLWTLPGPVLPLQSSPHTALSPVGLMVCLPWEDRALCLPASQFYSQGPKHCRCSIRKGQNHLN